MWKSAISSLGGFAVSAQKRSFSLPLLSWSSTRNTCRKFYLNTKIVAGSQRTTRHFHLQIVKTLQKHFCKSRRHSELKGFCVFLCCDTHLPQIGFYIEVERCACVCVTKYFLDALNICAAAQKQTCASMAEVMGRDIGQSRPLHKTLHSPCDCTWVTRLEGFTFFAKEECCHQEAIRVLLLALVI